VVGRRSSYAPGTFCWAKLETGDPEGATAFYAGLFGWEAVDMAVAAGGDATTFRLPGGDVCALERHDPRQGPPGWLSYVSVADAAEVTRRARDAGARVVREPSDAGGAARTAVVEDPTGAVFGLWEPRRRIGATLVNDPDAMCLNQLNTSDPEAAARFYTDVFRWRIQPVGTDAQPYWGIFNGEGLNGGMMPLPGGSGASHWLVYFASSDVDRSARRAAELGGRIVVPPVDIPNGRIAVALDPQGAPFALYAGNLDP
jgi:predicted enzyme related to lactoylglutathione lyase